MDTIHKIILFRSIDELIMDVRNVICILTLECHTNEFVYKNNNIFILLKNTIYMFSKNCQGMFIMYNKPLPKHSRNITNREYVLKHPAMYLGPEGKRVYQLHLEVIRNALEASKRDKTPIHIIMTHDSFCIKNTGHIPIVYNTGKLIPEFIYGNNCSKNSSKRGMVSNGCGVQIVNIYSNVFVVVICDHFNKLKYTQTWFYHMKYASNAIIEPYNGDMSTVEVTFTLDFERFNLRQYTNDDIQWYHNKFKKLSTKHNVPIVFN